MEPPRCAVFVARHGEREDYAWHKRGENWQATAARPWDSPLTPAGHLQARAMGAAAAAHAERLGLAPICHIACSPLLRCVETAAAAATATGVERVVVESRLSETMCEAWYRSWAVPGADSTWGGPAAYRKGVAVAEADLHPAARAAAAATHATAAELAALRATASLSDLGAGVPAVDGDARATFDYRWGHFETDAAQTERMVAVLEARTARGGSALLVSHGGPTGALYRSLTGRRTDCGYCGLFCYVRNADGSWDAPVAGDHGHLDAVPGADRSGRNDAAEQGPKPPDDAAGAFAAAQRAARAGDYAQMGAYLKENAY